MFEYLKPYYCEVFVYIARYQFYAGELSCKNKILLGNSINIFSTSLQRFQTFKHKNVSSLANQVSTTSITFSLKANFGLDNSDNFSTNLELLQTFQHKNLTCSANQVSTTSSTSSLKANLLSFRLFQLKKYPVF